MRRGRTALGAPAIVLALLFCLPCTVPTWAADARLRPARPARAELLSLAGLPLAEGEYVSRFELNTWAVEVLAVCNLPRGWTVSAGTHGDPGGVLSGTANIGAAFIGKERTDAFGSMFLVRIGQYRAQAEGGPGGERLPATFAGTAAIGRYGQDGAEREVTLSGRNVRRRAAERCPAPGR